MKTVLVTGAAGFIGQHLVTYLAERGHRVIGWEWRGRLPDAVRARCASTIHHDIWFAEAVAKSLQPCDAIIHAAAVCPFRESRPADSVTAELYLNTNTLGTLRLASAAKTAGVPRFIYLSTAQMYAPLTYPVAESAPMDPIAHTAYCHSKLGGEWHVRTVYPHNHVILRLGSAYGPGGFSVIDSFLRSAQHGFPLTVYGDGTARMNPLFVQDVAAVAEKALFTGHGPYNASGPSCTLMDAALAITEHYPRSALRFEEKPACSFPPLNTEKATAQWRIVFKPLREGLNHYAHGDLC